MARYKIIIENSFFGQFTAETEATDKETAIKETPEIYASELGTTEDQIKIISVTLIK